MSVYLFTKQNIRPPMGFAQKLIRKKYVDTSTVEDTELARCLSTADLTFLGVGSTLGAGIYVVAGQVAKETAGPAVVLSFLIAALASILAGLCYAEFGARVPKTGSAYVYSFVTVGELMAFVIGWNLILEYVIGTASVARAWSTYFDSLVNNTIQNHFKAAMPMDVPGLSHYPDFFALAITLFLTVVLAVGVKESSRFNNLFTTVNLLVVTYIVVCGIFKADVGNWSINPHEVTDVNATHLGHGGFMPFGFSGMFSGAATCFYAFVGFDAIATTGEEVKNPQKAIPFSIVVSLLVCFVSYSAISIIITLMCPYYLLDPSAPLPAVFARAGWAVAKYIIAIGAICGLSTSLLGAMFPLPRVIYAMASDGLLFKSLSRVNERFKTPLIGTTLSGIFAGSMAMLFDLDELVNMMSIGTLQAYTLVAVSVLILRYKVENIGELKDTEQYSPVAQTEIEDEMDNGHFCSDKDKIISESKPTGGISRLRSVLAMRRQHPTDKTETNAIYLISMFGGVATVFSIFLRFAESKVSDGHWWAILLAVIFGLLLVSIFLVLLAVPQNKAKLSFKVPWVPLLPCISVFINIFLMLRLPNATWIRFAVWMFIGFSLYFSYGIWHSTESRYHDNHVNHVPLLALKPLVDTDSDELFGDSDSEIPVYIDYTDNAED